MFTLCDHDCVMFDNRTISLYRINTACSRSVMRFVLCSRDLDVLHAQRIMGNEVQKSDHMLSVGTFYLWWQLDHRVEKCVVRTKRIALHLQIFPLWRAFSEVCVFNVNNASFLCGRGFPFQWTSHCLSELLSKTSSSLSSINKSLKRKIFEDQDIY